MDLSKLLKYETDLLLKVPVSHKVGDVEIEINTLTVGQVARINPYLIEIGAENISEVQKMIEEQKDDWSKLPALVNRCLNPMNEIIKVITGQDLKDKATFEDYFTLFALIYSRMGNLSFQKSIILISNMSPTRRTEIIAAQKFLTSAN